MPETPPKTPDDAVPVILARMREEINARFERLERIVSVRLDRIERELIQVRRETAMAVHEALIARNDALEILDRLPPRE